MTATPIVPIPSDPSLVISEVFGPTFQGEGPSLGRLAIFVRLGTCNLHCTWCDTPYTWDWTRFDSLKELHRFTIPQLVENIRAHIPDPKDPPILVITGGEPLLQRVKLRALLAHLEMGLNSVDMEVEVETNGTQHPLPYLKRPHYNVSPKLSGSGNDKAQAIHLNILNEFVERNSTFKFVVSNLFEFDEIDEMVRDLELKHSRVYIMPEGVTQEAVTSTGQLIAAATLQRGYNMTTRMHILLWGDTRGR